MKMIRCRVCGETYLGNETPSQCPFCGAHRAYLAEPGGFDPAENEVQLTEVEREDLEAAVELERSNARFYRAMAGLGGDHTLSSAYKRLATIEAEHCSLFCKLLKEPKPEDLMQPGEAPEDWCAGIGASLEREKRASAFYADASARATNERVREVFAAVAEVELDHIALDAVAATIAGCADTV